MTMIPAPLPGEILSSWLQRCAEAHGTDVMGWTFAFWGDWRVWTRDIDRSLSEERLHALARFSGQPPQRIREATLEPWVERIHGGRGFPAERAWPWVIPTGTRNRTRTNGLNFCPECLGEDPAFSRLEWRFSWFTACPRHGKVLVSRCPGCGQPFSPHLADWSSPGMRTCSRCGMDLASVPGETADPVVLSLQAELGSLMRGDLPETEERFAFVRDLAVLFRGMRKRRGLFTRMVRALGTDPRGREGRAVRGTAFDSDDPAKRHLFLGLAARFDAMGFGEQTELFRRNDVRKNTLAYFCPLLSDRMVEIRKRLKSNDRKGGDREYGKEPVHPRGRYEVEKAMDEIRRYL